MPPASNFWAILRLSLGFFFVYSSFFSCQNIASRVIADVGYGNLGFLNLAINFFTYGVSSTCAEPIVRRCGHRFMMFFCSLMYSTWVAAFLLPVVQFEAAQQQLPLPFSELTIKTVFLGSAFFLGMGSGPLWVAQAHYVAETADEKTKGRYNSLFLCIFYCSNFFASTISGKLLTMVSKSQFYIIMACVSLCGSATYLTLPKPSRERPSTSDHSEGVDNEKYPSPMECSASKEVDLNVTDFNASSPDRLVKARNHIPPERRITAILPIIEGDEGLAPPQASSSSDKAEASSSIDEEKTAAKDFIVVNSADLIDEAKQEAEVTNWQTLKDPKMRAMLGPLALRGIMAAAHGSLFVNFWVSTINRTDEGMLLTEDQKIEKAVLTYTAYGVGSVLGSLLTGLITDKLGYPTAIKFITCVVTLAFSSLLVQNELHSYSQIEAFGTMFLLGMVENSAKSFNNTVLGFEFKSAINAFQVGVMTEAMSTSSVLLSVPLANLEMKQETFRFFFALYLVLGVTSYTNLYFKFTRAWKVQPSRALEIFEETPSGEVTPGCKQEAAAGESTTASKTLVALEVDPAIQ